MRRFGRLPHDPARLAKLPQGAPYMDPIIGRVPDAIGWSRNVSPDAWGACLNDTIGDCTIAAVAHAIVGWSANSFSLKRDPYWTPSDDDVLLTYRAISGYVPGDAATDVGARCADVLTYWRGTGIECASSIDHLSAFCALDPRNRDHIRAALWAFGNVYAGVTLHQANLDETDAGSAWDDTASPIAGLHCVLVVAADDTGPVCVTWGALQRMTWSWWEACCDEAYGLLSARWLASGNAPQGLPYAALLQEMAALS